MIPPGSTVNKAFPGNSAVIWVIGLPPSSALKKNSDYFWPFNQSLKSHTQHIQKKRQK